MTSTKLTILSTGDDKKHLRLLVQRCECEGDDWKISVFVKIYFGDQPVATGLEVAKEIAAEEGKAIEEGMVSKMKKGG